ncbi:MAG: hypothetical protein Q7R50_06900 [Dehalococcoidales bacterium]|nr:hypothetical protein [Dehalococcoidales bacterium]
MVYSKIAGVGAIITGFIGWILAINAMVSNNELAAGVLLVASALAFGFLLIAVVPRNNM